MATKKAGSKKKAGTKKVGTRKRGGKKGTRKEKPKTALEKFAAQVDGSGDKPKQMDAHKAVDRSDGEKKQRKSAKVALERSRNYAASGLAAQVTETLIDEIRALDKPWHKTSEAEQSVVISRLADRVHGAMQKAVQVLSAQGHKAVICNLFSVTFKDGVRAVITVAPGSDLRHDLADYATRDCVLVLADPGVFMEGLENLRPDADQPKLI